MYRGEGGFYGLLMQETGNRDQGAGNPSRFAPGAGRKQRAGNREEGTPVASLPGQAGNREQGAGNREEGTGKREQEIVRCLQKDRKLPLIAPPSMPRMKKRWKRM